MGGFRSNGARLWWYCGGASRNGIAPSTIGKGIKNRDSGSLVMEPPKESVECVSRVGGRRKKIEEVSVLLGALESLVESSTRGDPESALRWTYKSLRVLAQELVRAGHEFGRRQSVPLPTAAITAVEAMGPIPETVRTRRHNSESPAA